MPGRVVTEPSSASVVPCLESWGWDPSPIGDGRVGFDADGIPGTASPRKSRGRNGPRVVLQFFVDDGPHPDLAQSWAQQERPPSGRLALRSLEDIPALVWEVVVALGACGEDLGGQLLADATALRDRWLANVSVEEQLLAAKVRRWGLELVDFEPADEARPRSGAVVAAGRSVDAVADVYRTGVDLSTIRVDYSLDSTTYVEAARAWTTKRRRLPLGVQLQLVEHGTELADIRLVADLPENAPTRNGRRLRDLADELALSWEVAADKELGVPVDLGWREALAQRPQSAWLLLGTDLSYPHELELARKTQLAERGVFDIWTANPQTRPGDLLLFYFMGKRKAVHFAARALSYAHFRPDIGVMSTKTVNPHQWWVRLSPLVELEPIPLSTLRAAFDGFLLLRGRAGRYIPPATTSQILTQARPVRPEEHRGTLKPPTVSVGPPKTLTEWRRFVVGELALTGQRVLETRVEEHLVDPLLALARVTETRKQYPVGPGHADYVVLSEGQAASVIEVKVRVKEPASQDWSSSPDFAQVMRYSQLLGDVPAALVDSHRVFLIHPGARKPGSIIERSAATRADLKGIRNHLLGTAGAR